VSLMEIEELEGLQAPGMVEGIAGAISGAFAVAGAYALGLYIAAAVAT
jgi:hypothetical protein